MESAGDRPEEEISPSREPGDGVVRRRADDQIRNAVSVDVAGRSHLSTRSRHRPFLL